MSRAVRTVSVGDETTRHIGGTTLPDSAPTAVTYPAAIREAHGVMPDSGYVSISVDAAVDITLYIFDKGQSAWVKAGASSSRHTLQFTEAGIDDFRGAPGVLLFFLASTTGKNGYTSAPPVNNRLGL